MERHNFINFQHVGVPNAGVSNVGPTNTGLAPNTKFPVPVSSLIASATCNDDTEARTT